jgi:hypothetical protein
MRRQSQAAMIGGHTIDSVGLHRSFFSPPRREDEAEKNLPASPYRYGNAVARGAHDTSIRRTRYNSAGSSLVHESVVNISTWARGGRLPGGCWPLT